MPSRTKSILCVEDHPDTCELIAAVLHEYKVISAAGVLDAVKMLAADSFDVVLLDYHLPDGTGVELCKLIRASDQKTPIVFVTGTSSITKDEITVIGAQGIVRKGTYDFIHRLLGTVEPLCG